MSSIEWNVQTVAFALLISALVIFAISNFTIAVLDIISKTLGTKRAVWVAASGVGLLLAYFLVRYADETKFGLKTSPPKAVYFVAYSHTIAPGTWINGCQVTTVPAGSTNQTVVDDFYSIDSDLRQRFGTNWAITAMSPLVPRKP